LKKNKDFIAAVLIDLLVFLLFLIGFLVGFIDFNFFLPFCLAQIVVIPNFVVGFSAILWSLRKNEQIFLLVVLGGMILRMAYILGMVFLLLYFLKISSKYFIFDIFLIYFYFLAAEVAILVKRKPQLSYKNNE